MRSPPFCKDTLEHHRNVGKQQKPDKIGQRRCQPCPAVRLDIINHIYTAIPKETIEIIEPPMSCQMVCRLILRLAHQTTARMGTPK